MIRHKKEKPNRLCYDAHNCTTCKHKANLHIEDIRTCNICADEACQYERDGEGQESRIR